MDMRLLSRAPDSEHYEAASDTGGRRAAAMYSLIESAKLNGLNPQFYLADLLARIADHQGPAYRRPSSLELAARRHRSRCGVSAGASTERLLINRHWAVVNDDIRKPRIRSEFDMITCISVIEHIKEHAAAFQSMIRLLQPGGHLVLTTPYNEQGSVPNVYDLPDAAYGKSLPYICEARHGKK
jgi:SAM-dependent methyltransferase